MATKKSPATKPAPKKKSAAKKSPQRKTTVKSARKTAAVRKPGGTLHSVARSIGSTLGTIAKKTSKAVEAAKQALPVSGSGVSTPDGQ